MCLQAVAQDLSTAQGKLATAGSELKQIALQAEQDSEGLKQARALITELQAQRTSASEHASGQLSVAQRDLRQAQADLKQARQDLALVQTQLSASQLTTRQEQVTSPKSNLMLCTYPVSRHRHSSNDCNDASRAGPIGKDWLSCICLHS